MNITEANAVNTVLRHAYGYHDDQTPRPTDEQVVAAAALLAGQAHKKLLAGITRQDVEDADALIRYGGAQA